MLKAGVTGGMGSGKTTVCKILETQGVPVYYADPRTKLLYFRPEVKQKVIGLLGEKAYLPDGSPDKQYIAAHIFTDERLLLGIEAILHPAVKTDFEEWLLTVPQDVPYVVKEAALLLESGSYKALDHLTVVVAPLALRIARVKSRDKVSEAKIAARMARQWPDEERLAFADAVIHNDEQQLLLPQVLELHKQLKSMSGRRQPGD